MSLFSVSKLLGKNRTRNIKRAGTSASLSSLAGDKETAPPPKSLTSSKLSTVITAHTPPGRSSRAESIVEVLSSDNESLSSFYGTPLAEISPFPPKSERAIDDHGEESDYTMVPELAFKPSEDWEQLDLSGRKSDDVAKITAAAVQEERERSAAELEATKQNYEHEIRLREEERERALGRVREMEDELTTVQDELHVKSKAIGTFTDDVEYLSAQIKSLETDKALLQTQLDDEKVAAEADATRLQDIIDLERTQHPDAVADLSTQISQLTAKIDGQQKHISHLETQLSESQVEASDLYAYNCELETKLLREEENAANAEEEEQTKDIQITVLEESHLSIATQLVDVQNSLTTMERQNRMLIDQLRQQSSEMSSSKGLRRPPATLTDRVGRVISGAGSNANLLDSAVRVIKVLNDEIYQTAASMTDQLESISRGISARFVAGDGQRTVLAANLKSMLGTELVKSLSSMGPDDATTSLMQVQTALQGCLIACSMRIITSWYPAEWEYGTFLVALFERIRGTDGLEKALQWRKTALKSCVPPTNLNEKLVGLFVDEISKIFSLSGWDKDKKLTEMLGRLAPKLSEIAALAVRLNKWTSAGVFGEAECVIAEPGIIYDSNRMANDDDSRRTDKRRSVRNVPPSEQVICTVGLGLQLVRDIDEEEDHILLKPKVVLYSALF